MNARAPGIQLIALILIILGVAVALHTRLSTSPGMPEKQNPISRSGRILSHGKQDSPFLHILADTSLDSKTKDIRAIQIPVSQADWELSPVGSQVPFFILPNGAPTIHLAEVPPQKSPGFGYLSAAALALAGLLLLAWWHRFSNPPLASAPSPDESPAPPILPKVTIPRKKNASPQIKVKPIDEPIIAEPKIIPPIAPPDAPLPNLEKIAIKDNTLYDGAFEFSYAAEKTQIILPRRAKLRINQYRPLADLGKILPDRDLLEVLYSAKSNWTTSETETGREALSRLISQKEVTAADQFFLNGDHLGLMFRDEVENGRWLAWLRGVWKIHPLTKQFADLVSQNALTSRLAANQILDEKNLSLIATLGPDSSLIRAAAKKTPRDRRLQDNRRTITLVADLIDAASSGKCYCEIHAINTDFSPAELVKKERYLNTRPNETKRGEDARCHHLACLRCHREYSVTAEVSGQTTSFHWKKDTRSYPVDI